MNARISLIVLLLYFCPLFNSKEEDSWSLVGNPLLFAHPCNGSLSISISFEPGLPPDQENQYNVNINKTFPISSKVKLKFDAEAIVTLYDNILARISSVGDDNEFLIHFYKQQEALSFNVKGVVPGVIPYFKSVNINTQEYCKKPWIGYLDNYLQGYKEQAISRKKNQDNTCGRRKVSHTELIVNGQSTKPGDWPWHVAINRRDKATIKYICGGTLITKSFVLTAAHCTSILGVPVVPEILNVVLGKYNLVGGDVASQERQVLEITVHDRFNPKTLDSDISLIKLKTIAAFDDYIQPACLWYDGAADYLPSNTVDGTVVGWGFDQNDALSTQLLQVKLPILPDSTCIRRNPVFYSKILNGNKFCAGLHNGTSPCNGDSGGGFVVFVPDTPKTASPKSPGAFYVRGIVSVTVSRTDAPICDPEQYVVFTDVAKYKIWLQNYIKDDI